MHALRLCPSGGANEVMRIICGISFNRVDLPVLIDKNVIFAQSKVKSRVIYVKSRQKSQKLDFAPRTVPRNPLRGAPERGKDGKCLQ